METNPIILVDDDCDDADMVVEAVKELQLPNEVICINSGVELLNFLSVCLEPPLLIICDINLTKKNGFEILKSLKNDKNVKNKNVPFILWSTFASPAQIQMCYDAGAQGIFNKPVSFKELCSCLAYIVGYWSICLYPKAGNIKAAGQT